MRRIILIVLFIFGFGRVLAQTTAEPPSPPTAPVEPSSPAAAPAEPGNTTAAKPETASPAPESSAPRPEATAVKPGPPDPKAPQSWLWETLLAGYTEKDYRAAVDALFADYERRLGRKLEPGPKRRAGLKVFTAVGGLSTPVALVRAVIGALEARGFKPNELYIVDQRQDTLRSAGFLPKIGNSNDATFDGVPVLFLESGRYYDPKSEANFDDPLAPSDWPAQQHVQQSYNWGFAPSDRASLLPVKLFQDTDFWINLPVGMDQEGLAFSGALVNASLEFASNTQRFYENERSGQMAVVNIITNSPELRTGWVFSILSLERYQYIGGPKFNSQYTLSEPLLFLSPNPVILDSILLGRINTARRRESFPVLDKPSYMDYANQPQLKLGSYEPSNVYLVRLPMAK